MEFWTVDTNGDRQPLLMMDGAAATFHVPTNIDDGFEPVPPAPAIASSFLAAGGTAPFQRHLQSDGNFVCYTADPATGALSHPQWDIAAILGRIDALTARVEKLERHRPCITRSTIAMCSGVDDLSIHLYREIHDGCTHLELRLDDTNIVVNIVVPESNGPGLTALIHGDEAFDN